MKHCINKSEQSSNRVLKAGIGYTIGNYLLKGLSFFTIPLFTRLLTTQDYGKYSVFLSYEDIVFVLIGFAIHSSYKNARYKSVERKTGKQVVFRTYFWYIKRRNRGGVGDYF